MRWSCCCRLFFFQAEDGIRDVAVTGVQTCALPISGAGGGWSSSACTSTASSYTFVGGVQHIGSFSDDNNIASSSSPVVTGDNGGTNGGQIVDNGCLNDLDCWGFSSHSYFTNLPSDTTVILTKPKGPVFIQYRYGDGLVIATTTSIE